MDRVQLRFEKHRLSAPGSPWALYLGQRGEGPALGQEKAPVLEGGCADHPGGRGGGGGFGRTLLSCHVDGCTVIFSVLILTPSLRRSEEEQRVTRGGSSMSCWARAGNNSVVRIPNILNDPGWLHTP